MKAAPSEYETLTFLGIASSFRPGRRPRADHAGQGWIFRIGAVRNRPGFEPKFRGVEKADPFAGRRPGCRQHRAAGHGEHEDEPDQGARSASRLASNVMKVRHVGEIPGGRDGSRAARKQFSRTDTAGASRRPARPPDDANQRSALQTRGSRADRRPEARRDPPGRVRSDC